MPHSCAGMTHKLLLAVLLPTCLMLQLTHAQSTFGDLRGTTRDPSGLPLDRAAVTVHSVEENNDRKLLSGEDGSFTVPNLQPGHYQLTAAKAGFQNSAAVAVELSARQSLRVDLTLALASEHQTIEVAGTSEQVNTENAVIGDSKVTGQIAQLPLNFRAVTSSPLAALAASPNVQQDSQANIDQTNRFRTIGDDSDAAFTATKLGKFPRDWQVTTLGAVCTRITDGTHQAVTVSREGIPFLYVSCVRDGMIYWSRAACVSGRDYKRIAKGREPRKGAVLYTAVGSYGHAAVVGDDRQFSFQRHMAILYPKTNELDPFFLATWLNSSNGRRWSDILAVGNAQKTVTLTALNKFPIAVPPFSEQVRLRAILEPADTLLAAKEQRLSALKALRTALMHDLLTGTVRVNPVHFKEQSAS